VEVSKTVILNLDKYSIGADYVENGAIYVKAGGSLTINGTGSLFVNDSGSLPASETGSLSAYSSYAIVNHGTLVINGGVISSLYNGQIIADTATMYSPE
jgi:hypothetical protein